MQTFRIRRDSRASPALGALDGDPVGAFGLRGYLGPVRLFSPRECRVILARLRREQRPPLDWRKGSAVTSSEFYALATHDRVLELVTRLIGGDVLLWGASLVARGPGHVHPWHTDIESSSPEGETVAVWIGLANTSSRSSLKVVPCSHRFGLTLQQLSHESGAGREALTDELVAGWSAERGGQGEVVTLGAADGEAVVFDGRLWHGSHNLNRHMTRYAALLQYATPRTPIRMPETSRFAWPFESHRSPRPPCVVVSGSDTAGVNRLVSGPAASDQSGLPALTTRVHPLRLPLEQDAEVGWKPHSLFRGATPNLKAIKCHASVLDPGRQPHPPHRHDEEELLVVLDGEAELVLESGKEGEQPRRRRARRGTFAYYPSGFAHTINNVSDAPVTYVMFKWNTDREERGDLLGHRLVPLPEPSGEPARAPSGDPSRTPSPGFSTERVLDGGTKCLRHLHSHLTTLRPGAGYAPHVDAHDVAIVVLEGTVETLGEQVGPNGIVFYAAGESHGMRNTGDGAAVYLVFEFHGRHLPHRRPKRRRSSPLVRAWRLARRARLIARSLAGSVRRRP